MHRPVTLVMEYPAHGPAADALARTLREMMDELPVIPGLCWKIWTEDADRGQVGGIYRFADSLSARAYRDRQAARLAAIGVGPVITEMQVEH